MSKLSLCFPVYNKVDAIDDVVESFLERADLARVQFVFFDNASSDGSTEKLLKWKEKLNGVYARVESTLSINESWFSCIRLVDTAFFKLCLGDDPCVADPVRFLDRFDDPAVQFIVGKTLVEAEDGHTGKEYFELVHQCRSQIVPTMSDAEKIELLLRYPASMNRFGDINSWIFSSNCLAILPDCGRTYHAPMSFPDFEIQLRVFLNCAGQFVDKFIGCFSYSAVSPAVRKKHAPALRANDQLGQTVICLEYLFDSMLLPALTAAQTEAVHRWAARSLIDHLTANIGVDVESLLTRPMAIRTPPETDPPTRSLRRRIRSAWAELRR